MKRLSVPAACAALWSWLSAPALAAPQGEDTPISLEGGGEQAASGGGGLIRTVVGLAIVIAVIYGLYWVLRQVKASREATASGGGLSSIASLPLGTNRAVHVVRAGNEVLVLGATEHGITRLRAYPEQEARAAGLLDDPGVIDVAPLPERRALPALPAAGNVLESLRALTVRR